jgi:hypothetical protein
MSRPAAAVADKLDCLRDANGNLPQYVHGYPVLYLDRNDSILCAECASSPTEFDLPAVNYGPFWEGPSEICDNCSKEIESAYGDPADS